MIQSSHSSMFSYGITRSYPFRWFTYVVLFGGVLFTILFSFLNFVSNGYHLVVQTSSDPNATVSEGVWFQNWPSYLSSKIRPTCQSVYLPVDSQLFTNKTALTYILASIWQTTDGGTVSVLPTLTYHNNVLQQCSVSSIELDLEALDRTGSQIAFAEWGVVVRSYITCELGGSDGIMLNLSATYDYVPASTSFAINGILGTNYLGTGFLDRDPQNRSSLYWGESMMSMYWAYLSRTMQDIRVNTTELGGIAVRKGSLIFTPNPASVDDITSLDFFDIDYRLVVDQGEGIFGMIYPGTNSFATTVANLDRSATYPNIWIPADTLAKSTYSTILTDLGNVGAKANFLTNPETLQHFTSNFSVALRHIANARPGPAVQDYDTLKNTTGPLGVTYSVISTRYLCQVPRRKSTGDIFVSVLLADLVFLQALWNLFKLGVDYLVVSKHPDANHCLGCLAARDHDESSSIALGQMVGDEEGTAHGLLRLPRSAATERPGYHRRTTSQQDLLRSSL